MANPVPGSPDWLRDHGILPEVYDAHEIQRYTAADLHRSRTGQRAQPSGRRRPERAGRDHLHDRDRNR